MACGSWESVGRGSGAREQVAGVEPWPLAPRNPIPGAAAPISTDGLRPANSASYPLSQAVQSGLGPQSTLPSSPLPPPLNCI